MRSAVWAYVGVVGIAVLGVTPAFPQGTPRGGPISGIVVDSRGQPVPNARVAVQGTALETRTDASGQFRLADAPGPLATIRVAVIGYQPLSQEVRVGDPGIRLTLNESAVQLNAIVVTGTAGAAERRTIGNAIATISAPDLRALAPAQDVTQLINGRAPGVTVVPGTGVVGGGPRINIRGQSSLSLSDQPLLYVDGVRVDNDVATGPKSQGYGSGVISRLADFNPDDIESVEIIKGPAAATLYGTEASNGVIHIITKKGRAESRPQLGLIVRQGANWFMNPEGRIPPNYYRDASGQAIAVDLVARENARGTPIWTTGWAQQYGASLSGGSASTRYLLSSNYDDNRGVEVNNRVRRFTGRANVSVTPSDAVDLTVSTGIVRGEIDLADDIGTGRMFGVLYGLPQFVNTPRRGFWRAPPAILDLALQQGQEVDRTTVSLQLNHRPTKWLTHRAALGLDQTDEFNWRLQENMKPEVAQFFPANTALGSRSSERREVTYTTLDYSATVKANLSSRFASALSAGAQLYRRRTEFTTATGQRFPAPNLKTVSAAALTFGSEDRVENTTVGSYVQEQIGLNDRVFLTAALRVDNNSAFGENFTFATYPKVSATWVISEEPFWRFGFVDALKLRAAFGQSGQQPESFAALRTFQAVTTGGGRAAVSPRFIGNPDLGPERGTEFEAGLEASLFDDRISVDFTFYHKKTTDAILLRNVAPSLGFSGSQFVNVGSLRNQGQELQLTALVLRRERGLTNWDLGFKFSHNENKVLDLGDLGPAIIVPSNLDTPGLHLRHQPGLPAGSWFGKKVIAATLDANGVAQNVRCDGALPDGRPSGVPVDCATAPAVYLGRSDPNIVGSVNTSIRLFNRITLYGLLDFKLGVLHGDNDAVVRCQLFQTCRANYFPQEFDPRTVAEYQSGGSLASFGAASASFAKLREVSVSVTLPASWMQAVKVTSGTFTLAMRNLHTWSKWTSTDPESFWVTNQFDKSSQTFTPQLTSLLTTLNLTF
ncbi:MAG: SusC/RagA family TonB-linked outer membrane protein [Gemmatimonadetes bacterium]|nr:SusC/RagA family TonB-linked outer membrane protein [Gemmatimonadota bacterium]